MRHFALILLPILLVLMPTGRAKAQDPPTGAEKARAAQFLTPQRLAHAIRMAYEAAHERAEAFPTMPKAFDNPLALDAASFESEVQRTTGKTLGKRVLLKKLRLMMQGKRVTAGSQRPENGIRLTLAQYSGVKETETGYRVYFRLYYDNSENKKFDHYVGRDTDLVWLYYEKRGGEWRIVDTKVGQIVH